MTDNSPTAICIGGGPAGALTAKVLAERGFNVHLYESFPHPADNTKTESSKAYVISINPRGQLALKRCGVDPMVDLDAAVISEAVVRHGKKTKVVRHNGGTHRSVMVRRRTLAASLLRAAEKVGVQVNCGWRLTNVDFDKRQVTLVESTNASNEKTVSYDLLVGADGVRSKTRTLLSNHLNEKGEPFNVKTIDDDMEYQVAIMPRPWADLMNKESVSSAPLDTCPPASLHSWSDTKSGITALGFPMRESNDSPIDKLSVCVICPAGMLGKLKESGIAGYASTLSATFADWTSDSRLELAHLLAKEENTPNTGGVCVWSQALSHPESGVVLVGDAGHGMWPSLGQGCNAALESVAVFADAIEAANGTLSSGVGCRVLDFFTASNKDIAEAIAIEYDGLRRDDALAVVDLTYGGIGGTKVRGSRHAPVIHKVQMFTFMLLNKLTSGVVPMPAMLRMIKGDNVAYSTLKLAHRVEKYVAYGVVLTVLGCVLSQFV